MAGNEVAATTGGGGNNASEFVRKLYRMLEDPSHQDVARWGKDGDTFVVVEGEKFTRHILPKHFKHSNMSSFIRQLNKYDFHKVKPSSDSENSSPLGNVLEFKHQHFRIDSKDDLDNIRRKAPAPRKAQMTEDFTAAHHISVISEQLTATQQQVQQLQELFTEVSQTNKVLVNEVLTLQKILNAQKQAQHEMLNYLTPYDSQQNTSMLSQPMGTNGRTASDGDDSVPELRRARELLSSVSTDTIQDRELERLNAMYASPADSGSIVTPTTMPLLHDPMNDITRYPVYPVGQTIGIDPFHSDHIHKIPYAMPNDNSSGTLDQTQQPQPVQQISNTNTSEGLWGARKPRVFLVEDDSVCAKIGMKFLKSMGCEVEHASDGVEAYQRLNNMPRDHFDLIFMDIIMPRLDGVSATMYIRQNHPAIPVIAMTSNIRPEEVHGYFEHGMNGVLAKPFTKEGMLERVKTGLSHLLKNPLNDGDISSNNAYFLPNSGYLGGTMKLESPTPPASTGNNWGQMGSGFDQSYGIMNGNTQYAPVNTRQTYTTTMQSADSSSGRISDVESPPGKRQRMNPSQGY